MRKLIYIWSLFMAVIMCSCEKHVIPVDLTLRVGNIYRADGSIVPPAHHRVEDETAPEAVGVVVSVGEDGDGYSALVMSLYDLQGSYCYAAETGETDASTDTELFNGKENTAILLSEYAENEKLDPRGAIMASAYYAGGVAGWHLPSVGEMQAVITDRYTIRESISIVGGDDFSNEWYLTSTVDGSSSETAEMYNYCVIMPEGRVVSELKTMTHKVRPFLIIR